MSDRDNKEDKKHPNKPNPNTNYKPYDHSNKYPHEKEREKSHYDINRDSEKIR